MIALLLSTVLAQASTYTLSICRPDNTMDSGEPLVIVAPGEIAHLTPVEMPGSDEPHVRQFPVVRPDEARATYLGWLGEGTVGTTMQVQTGRTVALRRDHDGHALDQARVATAFEVETEILREGERWSLSAHVPVGKHEVSWTLAKRGSDVVLRGRVDTVCETRAFLVR